MKSLKNCAHKTETGFARSPINKVVVGSPFRFFTNRLKPFRFNRWAYTISSLSLVITRFERPITFPKSTTASNFLRDSELTLCSASLI